MSPDPIRTRSGYWVGARLHSIVPGTVRVSIVDDEDPEKRGGVTLTPTEAFELAQQLTVVALEAGTVREEQDRRGEDHYEREQERWEHANPTPSPDDRLYLVNTVDGFALERGGF